MADIFQTPTRGGHVALATPRISAAQGYAQGYQARHHDDAWEADVAAEPASAYGGGARVAAIGQVLGGLISLGLVVGVSLWGYQLIMRDVSGVPVVRAMEGPMRVAPELPGGAQAPHQGLAVNEVAGRSGAGGPVAALKLAPPPLDLSAEDQPVEALHWARADASDGLDGLQDEDADPAFRQTALVPAPNGSAPQDAAIQALADQIAADVAPLSALAPIATEATEVQVQTAVAQVILAPGGARSLRPLARPAALGPAVPTSVAQASVSAPVTADLDPASLSAGTRLVQLGAYGSVEVAEQEWQRISARFDSFFVDKRRVIERAESGVRTFYRLRAEGFADAGDARRFCAALVAERADCIPVVIR